MIISKVKITNKNHSYIFFGSVGKKHVAKRKLCHNKMLLQYLEVIGFFALVGLQISKAYRLGKKQKSNELNDMDAVYENNLLTNFRIREAKSKANALSNPKHDRYVTSYDLECKNSDPSLQPRSIRVRVSCSRRNKSESELDKIPWSIKYPLHNEIENRKSST